jgi:hypothetical protein
LKIMLMMSGYPRFVGMQRRLVLIFKSGYPVRKEASQVKTAQHSVQLTVGTRRGF